MEQTLAKGRWMLAVFSGLVFLVLASASYPFSFTASAGLAVGVAILLYLKDRLTGSVARYPAASPSLLGLAVVGYRYSALAAAAGFAIYAFALGPFTRVRKAELAARWACTVLGLSGVILIFPAWLHLFQGPGLTSAWQIGEISAGVAVYEVLYFGADHLLNTLVKGQTLRAMVEHVFRSQAVNYLLTTMLLLLIASLPALDSQLTSLVLLPVLAVVVAAEVYLNRTNHQQFLLDLLEQLRGDGHHDQQACELVASWAVDLAEAAALNRQQRQDLRQAVIIHGLVFGNEEAGFRQHAFRLAGLVAHHRQLLGVAQVLREHHEWMDGSGYPAGLTSDQILPAARVMAVIHGFCGELLGNEGGLEERLDRALEHLETGAGSQYDPRLVQLFVRQLRDGQVDPERLLQLVAGPSSDQLNSLEAIKAYMDPGHLPSDTVVQAGSHLVPELTPMFQAMSAAIEVDSRQVFHFMMNALEAIEAELVYLILLPGRQAGEWQLEWHNSPLLAAPGEQQEAVCMQLPPALSRAIEDRDILYLRSGSFLGPSVKEALGQHGLSHLALVPMNGHNQVRGLLVAASPMPLQDLPVKMGLVATVALYAGVALDNRALWGDMQAQQQELESTNNFLRGILNNVRGGLLVLDGRGQAQYYNDLVARLIRRWLELDPEQPLPTGFNCCQWLAAQFEMPTAPFQSYIMNKPFAGQFTGPGSRIYHTLTGPYYNGQGDVAGVVVHLHDITKQFQLRDELAEHERLAAVGELAAGAAHEIRNPLAAVRGFMQLLRQRSDNQAMEYVDISLQEIDRIEELVTDMLLMARHSSLDGEPVDINALCEEVLAMTRAGLDPAEGGRVSLVSLLVDDLPTVWADRNQLKQVLINLVRNAVDALDDSVPADSATVTVQTSYQADCDQVLILVMDTGRGMTTAVLEKIFEPFYTSKEGGTGLGLPVSWRIVKEHQGSLVVGSEPGKGTIFLVALPTG